MWEDQIHAATVDIEMFAQILFTHSRTFAVPSGETVAPRRRPTHDMLRLCAFPESEVDRITFFILSVQCAGSIQHIVDVASGKNTVIMIFVVFLHVEVNGTFAFVSISVIQYFLYQFDLLDDMAGRMRFDAGR